MATKRPLVFTEHTGRIKRGKKTHRRKIHERRARKARNELMELADAPLEQEASKSNS